MRKALPIVLTALFSLGSFAVPICEVVLGRRLLVQGGRGFYLQGSKVYVTPLEEPDANREATEFLDILHPKMRSLALSTTPSEISVALTEHEVALLPRLGPAIRTELSPNAEPIFLIKRSEMLGRGPGDRHSLNHFIVLGKRAVWVSPLIELGSLENPRPWLGVEKIHNWRKLPFGDSVVDIKLERRPGDPGKVVWVRRAVDRSELGEQRILSLKDPAEGVRLKLNNGRILLLRYADRNWSLKPPN